MKKRVTDDRLADSTLAIHAGEKRSQVSVPVGTSIARTANFTFANTEEMKRWAEGKSPAYIYTRYGNPTLAIAEEKIAALEGAEAAIVAASGMAAISSALLSILKAGDEVIATRALYGGSYRLMRDIFPRMGIVVRHVETDLAGIERLVNPRTRALYIETPTNPTLRLVDLQKAVSFAKEWDLLSLIDNTFATPVVQKPIKMGFDLVVHSATKYLAGHSDVIAGVAVGSHSLIEKIRDMIIYLGGSMDPEAAFLLIRGMKTLQVRVPRQCQTALTVARYLEEHPKVARVHYPGLPSHPDHKLAKRQMKGFGAMMAFDLKGGLAAARRFCDRTRVFLLAASLGGVESLVVLPIYSSHYRMSAAELRAAGVEPGTVRVSIGLEDPADLIEDVRQALA
ncbi:MAG TPA: aminotransferase class I/II-fold pyridoxal phosphate-dependent enzyme [Candidatus Acidoferrales bacterium]|nr:aminotransferase class I/II-fold pyridoxal phosphate-dependent enzyme [Candidatus Acidoferrales bacterium]